jgi:hypothetical protein
MVCVAGCTRVGSMHLNVARSLAKADSVSIEPFNEDDWEILESPC